MHPEFAYALINGVLIPYAQAQIPLTHPVFLTSYGVYESIQIDRGRPFCLRDHLERLLASAAMLGIALPPLDTLLDWATELINALPPDTYALQVLVLGGSTTNGSQIAFLPKPIRKYPSEYYTKGVGAITFEGQRAIPQCKSLNTLINHLARTAAQQQGAVEAILVHQNMLYEGARSNVFVVEAAAGRLVTPPAHKTLSGITKDVVFTVMKDTPYPVHEADVFADTPFAEMFITSTSMHVLPITSLNGKQVGDGKVGPITTMVAERFEKYYQDNL